MVQIGKAADCSLAYGSSGTLGSAFPGCGARCLLRAGSLLAAGRCALSWRVFFPSRLQDYYSGGYYPAQDPALVPSQEIAPDASFIDDEAVS